MPSLIGTDIAANYRQQMVPFSRFGTRKVAWFKVGRADTNNGGIMDMQNFNTLIDAIQTQAELVMVGAPYVSDNWGKFMIAVFEDTLNDGSNTDGGANAHATTLQDTVRNIVGDSGIIVQRFYLFGAPQTDEDNYYGFSVDSTYQEYDYKSQFVANSYTQGN